MYQAIFETPRFEFQAFEATYDGVIELLKEAWSRHAKQTGADPQYLDKMKSDIQIIEIRNGTVFRDKELLYKK